jgi:hypothetical protein
MAWPQDDEEEGAGSTDALDLATTTTQQSRDDSLLSLLTSPPVDHRYPGGEDDADDDDDDEDMLYDPNQPGFDEEEEEEEEEGEGEAYGDARRGSLSSIREEGRDAEEGGQRNWRDNLDSGWKSGSSAPPPQHSVEDDFARQEDYDVDQEETY